ncbi:hypothetical protein BH11MYX2_BH11MYX2_25100 [soil metagenome]
MPSAVSIPEQVVGSSHEYAAVPVSLKESSLSATVIAFIEPTDGTENITAGVNDSLLAYTSPGSPPVATSDRSQMVYVRFAPTRTGEYSAQVVVKLFWSNGHVEIARVPLTARARTLEQLPIKPLIRSRPQVSSLPVDPRGDTERHLVVGDYTGLGEVPAAVSASFKTATERLATKATNVIDRAKDGVHDASLEALQYNRKAPEPDLMEVLIESALSAGIAGIAGVIAKGIGKKVDGEGKSGPAVFVTEVVKDLSKKAGHAGVDELRKKLKGGNSDHGRKGAGEIQSHGSPASTNSLVLFFGAQRDALSNVTSDLDDSVRLRTLSLLPRLRSDPEAVVTEIDEEADRLNTDAKSGEPTRIQAQMSALGWMKYIEQVEMGMEEAASADGRRHLTVSKPPEGEFASPDGLLTLVVRMKSGDDVSKLQVVRAGMYGIAQHTAERLYDEPLAKLGIPIRILVEGEIGDTNTIFVDEGGRVRTIGRRRVYTAKDGYLQAQPTEPQQSMLAEKIVARALSKTLSSWDAPIHTDDDSGRKREG